MFDYAEKVMELREAAEKSMCGECGLNLAKGSTKKGILFSEAADAIEELLARVTDTNVGKCKDCATQHIDPDGLRWCEELSMIVADDFYCGYWEKPAPPKGVE